MPAACSAVHRDSLSRQTAPAAAIDGERASVLADRSVAVCSTSVERGRARFDEGAETIVSAVGTAACPCGCLARFDEGAETIVSGAVSRRDAAAIVGGEADRCYDTLDQESILTVSAGRLPGGINCCSSYAGDFGCSVEPCSAIEPVRFPVRRLHTGSPAWRLFPSFVPTLDRRQTVLSFC